MISEVDAAEAYAEVRHEDQILSLSNMYFSRHPETDGQQHVSGVI
jgi:hypothetical protein